MDCGEIRELMEQGREREAAGRLLELVAELSDRLNTLEIQFETLVEALAPDPDDYPYDEDCDSYVVQCPGCGEKLEIPAEFLEEDGGALVCPDCGAALLAD